MKTLFTSTVLAAAFAVAGSAVFAEGTVYSFPAPIKTQVKDVLNMGGDGPSLIMQLDDFCALNADKITELAKNCSMEAWIDKDEEITIRL